MGRVAAVYRETVAVNLQRQRQHGLAGGLK